MSYVYDIYQYFSDELQKIVLAGFKDTIQFFQALQNSPIDPAKVAPFAAQAVATIAAGLFTLYLIAKYLIKAAKKIDEAASKVGELLAWVTKIIKDLSKFSERLLKILLRRGILALTRKSTYINFMNWCGMMSPNQEAAILHGSKDGSTFVRYQRAMGISTLVVAIWSTFAFSYSIYAALVSGDGRNEVTFYAIPLGGVLYGALIFFFDRSIIAPFHSDPKSNIQGTLWVRLTHQLSQIDLSSIGKVILRGFLTFMIAKFTALPMTMLLLGGSIKTIIDDHNQQSQGNSAVEVRTIADRKAVAQQAKEQSLACRNSIEALRQHDQLIQDEARNCASKNAKGPCIGEKTKDLQSQRPQLSAERQVACNLSQQEGATYDLLINRQNSIAVKEWKNPPDILLGGYVLDIAENKYKSSFNPVQAIFYVLFMIEMIPVFMKILKGNSPDRRKSADRRQRNDPWPYAERRKEDRRLRIVA